MTVTRAFTRLCQRARRRIGVQTNPADILLFFGFSVVYRARSDIRTVGVALHIVEDTVCFSRWSRLCRRRSDRRALCVCRFGFCGRHIHSKSLYTTVGPRRYVCANQTVDRAKQVCIHLLLLLVALDTLKPHDSPKITVYDETLSFQRRRAGCPLVHIDITGVGCLIE